MSADKRADELRQRRKDAIAAVMSLESPQGEIMREVFAEWVEMGCHYCAAVDLLRSSIEGPDGHEVNRSSYQAAIVDAERAAAALDTCLRMSGIDKHAHEWTRNFAAALEE